MVILHTNDIHGQVLPRLATWVKDVNPPPDSGGLPRLAAAINRERALAEEAGAAVFVVDAGDWFQGTPEGQVERGGGIIDVLRVMGYDALAVGNHEFDHGVGAFLLHLATNESWVAGPDGRPDLFPVVAANVQAARGSTLLNAFTHVQEQRRGTSVAFVGLLTTTTPEITHHETRDLKWIEPAVALADARRELGDDVDLVVPLTHMGIEEDRELARAHPDLPLIVGGHSHSFLRKGVREGDTLIVQAGAKASVLGRVDLWLDADGDVTRSTSRLIELLEEPEDRWRNPDVERLCADLVKRAAARMNVVVGVLGRPLEVTRRELVNASAGNLIADALRAHTGADIAVHNRGGIRTTLPAGPVTRRDLFSLLPFDNHIAVLTMDGTDVIELFRLSLEDRRLRPLEFSGVRLVVRREAGKPRLVEVRVGGRAIAPGDRLTVATNSFLAGGGDGWTLLEGQTERRADPTLLRDALEAAFGGGALTPAVDQRHEIVP